MVAVVNFEEKWSKEGTMSKKLIFVMLLALCMLFQGGDLWADDDAIMDVDDNAATFTGSWVNSKYRILYYGDDYEYARGAGSSSGATAVATFRTLQTADISGTYHVYVRWTAGTARDTSALYRVYDGTTYAGGCIKDQRYNGGAWQFCREVYLTAGNRGKVTLTNENTPTNRYTCADAVRFVRVEKDKYDIVDEAGVEYKNGGSSSNVPTSVVNCDSISVSVPRSGWVQVECKAYAITFGERTVVELGVSTASTTIGEYTRAGVLDGTDTKRRVFPMHTFAVFPVSAGTRTFYCNAKKETSFAARTVNLGDIYMKAVYYPTRY